MNMLVLVVQVADQTMAIPADDVVSVIELGPIVPVPHTQGHILGLAAMRSQILTVIDCGRQIRQAHQISEESAGRAVVISRRGQHYALAVDRIRETITVDANVLPTPSQLDDRWRSHTKGMLETGAGLVLLMDVEAMIFGPSELITD